jgi:predicted RNA-binding Zn-ribbon protein involved in translation (DUF1610 family)
MKITISMNDAVEMKCPICNHEVIKSRESEREIKNNVMCENEYYVHYKNVHDQDVLNKFPEANVNSPETRFKS